MSRSGPGREAGQSLAGFIKDGASGVFFARSRVVPPFGGGNGQNTIQTAQLYLTSSHPSRFACRESGKEGDSFLPSPRTENGDGFAV